jgi:Phage integrase, N-terminal SAM-like domain
MSQGFKVAVSLPLTLALARRTAHNNLSPFRSLDGTILEKGAVGMFLQEAIDDYASYARTELGHASTIVLTYRSRQRHFARWLAETSTPDPKIEDVTAGHIRRYTYALSALGNRPRSIRGAMNAVRALYAYSDTAKGARASGTSAFLLDIARQLLK